MYFKVNILVKKNSHLFRVRGARTKPPSIFWVEILALFAAKFCNTVEILVYFLF